MVTNLKNHYHFITYTIFLGIASDASVPHEPDPGQPTVGCDQEHATQRKNETTEPAASQITL